MPLEWRHYVEIDDQDAERLEHVFGTNMVNAEKINGTKKELLSAIKTAIGDTADGCPICAASVSCEDRHGRRHFDRGSSVTALPERRTPLGVTSSARGPVWLLWMLEVESSLHNPRRQLDHGPWQQALPTATADPRRNMFVLVVNQVRTKMADAPTLGWSYA